MISERINNRIKTFTPFFLITLTNVLAHGFLFILSGTFWDDFLYLDYNVDGLWRQFLAAGIPSRAIITQMVWKLPDYGYRTVVWFLYLVTSILFYLVLKDSGFFNRHESLIASLISVVIPLNSCRLSLCTVECSIGLMFFMLGFHCLILYQNRKRIQFRFFSLFFFFFSFLLNSNLVFYVIPIIYIFVSGYQNKEYSLCFKKICYFFIKKADYILAPVVFFVLKNILFPTFGAYENYNHVDLGRIINAIKLTIVGTFSQIKAVILQFLSWTESDHLLLKTAVFFLVLLVVEIIIDKKKKSILSRIIEKQDCIRLFVGIISLWAGEFSYISVRQTSVLSTSGVQDRDCILIPFGLSIIICSVISVLYKNAILKNIAVVAILLFGIVSFNNCYLKFQRVAYWQDSLGNRMLECSEIKDNNTFLFLYDNYFDTDYGIRFYSLNGVANYQAFHDSTRCFLHGHADLKLLDTFDYLGQGYGMDDYDFSDTELDGIIIYNCFYSLPETMKIKMYELFDREKYEKEIKSHGTIEYYSADTEDAAKLLG